MGKSSFPQFGILNKETSYTPVSIATSSYNFCHSCCWGENVRCGFGLFSVIITTMNTYTHIGKYFYINAGVPSDVTVVEMEAGGIKVSAKKLFWRFYKLC